MLPIFKDIKLFIATPFYEVKAYSPYCKCLVDSARVLWTLGIDFIFHIHNGDSYVDRARNTICAKFLESDCTDLLFIDSDMTWNLEAIGMMLIPPQEVVGAVYPMKNQWGHYAVGLNTDENGSPIVDPLTGLLSAEWVMAGFLRIKRSCLEKMAGAYKDLAYQDPNADPVNPGRIYTPFFELKLGKGGEDMTFCRRWKAIGGEVWVEPRITFGHFGIQEWTGNYHEFLRRQPGGSRHGLKTLFVTNFNSCLPDLSSYFDYGSDLGKVDAAIIWNDILPDFKEFCHQAKAKKVPTFVMLHGLMIGVDYDSGIFTADYYLVWSEKDKQWLMERGCSENRIFVVGCSLFKQRTSSPDGKTVVYFPAHFSDEQLLPEVHATSMKVWNRLGEMNGVRPLAKLLTRNHPEADYPGEKLVSDRAQPNHLDILYEILKNASCMVTDEIGTNLLIACYLDIPIIKIKNDFPNCFPDLVTETDLPGLRNAVKYALYNPKHLQKERQTFAKMNDHGDCVKNIYDAIMKVIDK